MGRLPTLVPFVGKRTIFLARALCILSFTVLGCRQEQKIAPTRERSEVVQASGSTAPVAPSPLPATNVAPDATGARKLCEGQLAKPGHDLPKRPLSRKAAMGTKALGSVLVTPGSGAWTWVNLWAAWCAPCKEEMPRLRRFVARLAQAGSNMALSFVSVDDDERQLEEFLAGGSADGIHATFWLREGRERDDWLTGAGLGRDPSLPVQVLVDPKGKIRCVVNGAIADQDYAEIAAIVSAP